MVLKQTSITIPDDLTAAIVHAYEPNGLMCNHFEKELESEEYGAFTFKVNDVWIKFRIGKITPRKVGSICHSMEKNRQRGYLAPRYR